jgi:5-(carboxyamino)imidazole ribonucleotide synthase
MLAISGYPLGLHFRALDHNTEAPVRDLSDLVVGEFNDSDSLDKFADKLDIITYEFENIPVETARLLNTRIPVFPPPEALQFSQDRLVEKRFFEQLGIPTPLFEPVNSLATLEAALEKIGMPAVLKTRRMGYDGKGQSVLRSNDDLATAMNSLQGVPAIVESFIRFDRELSILSVRGRDGETLFYPLIENRHEQGILRLSLAPADNVANLQHQAEDYAYRVLDALNYVGVLSIEFFEYQGRLSANEMAPRVHNSGHWTIEGAETSQFENHLRAICGLPLGSTSPVGYSAMINLIGKIPDLKGILALSGAHLHLYDKAPRPLRKLGHVTIRTNDRTSLTDKFDYILDLLTRGATGEGL